MSYDGSMRSPYQEVTQMGIFDRFTDAFSTPDPESYTAPAGIPSPHEPRELVLYKSSTCPYCMRVMSEINRTGINVVYRDIREDPSASADLYERTGRGTVPCLYVDDVPFFESADIKRWLQVYAVQGGAQSEV